MNGPEDCCRSVQVAKERRSAAPEKIRVADDEAVLDVDGVVELHRVLMAEQRRPADEVPSARQQ
jgi:hypothetical protein